MSTRVTTGSLSDDPDLLVREAVEALFGAALRAAQVVGRRGLTTAETAAIEAGKAGMYAKRRLKKAGHLYQEATR